MYIELYTLPTFRHDIQIVVHADATTGTGMYFREADGENASLTMRQTLLMRFMSQSTPEMPDQPKGFEMLNSLRRRFLGDVKNHGLFAMWATCMLAPVRQGRAGANLCFVRIYLH